VKPVTQTKLHTEEQNGNCLATAFASLLEIPISDVPEFENMNAGIWFAIMKKWLESIGFDLIEWREEEPTHLKGYYMVCGKSPRGDFNHQVIHRAGKLAHDPHPSQAGVIGFVDAYALVPLDPAKHLHKGKTPCQQ